MKSIVIYFSQTGNTEKIAKAIQKGIIQAAGNCDLAEIREVNPLRLKEYDLIGLGSMVMGQAPANVVDFVGKMRFVGGKHIFVFCTHGTSYSRFVPSLYPNLKKRGLVLIGSADWYGDCYLLHMLQPYPTAGHPDAIDLQEAEDFGREMVIRSWKITAGETNLIPSPPPELPPMPMPSGGPGAPKGMPTNMTPAAAGDGGPGAPKGMPPLIIGQFSSKLKFYKEKCLYPACTLCVDNCPVYGIDLSVNPPILAQPCLDCEFCARLCPTGALDMTEWVEAMAKMTNAPRPNKEEGAVRLSTLEKDEISGHFRRHVPVDQIGKTAGYKQLTKNPQWIIGKGPNK